MSDREAYLHVGGHGWAWLRQQIGAAIGRCCPAGPWGATEAGDGCLGIREKRKGSGLKRTEASLGRTNRGTGERGSWNR